MNRPKKRVQKTSIRQKPLVPLSPEELGRARRQTEALLREESALREMILERLRQVCDFYRFDLFSFGRLPVHAYVFFETDADLEAARANATLEKLEAALLEALVALGIDPFVDDEKLIAAGSPPRWRQRPNVILEFDSHEQVQKKFNGNYWNRLH